MNLPTLEEMLAAGMHFGHRTSRWHPNMAPYIVAERNNVHIINLDETRAKLETALNFIKDLVSKGGVLLFVGSKEQAKAITRAKAESVLMPHVTDRWLGGTITNFGVISRLIKTLKDLKSKRASGELEKYTKKERHDFDLEIRDLEEKVGGIASLDRLPDAIFILDVKNESTAVREAKRKKVPIVGVCDTNTDPSGINYMIPANDDAVKSIEMIISLVAEAVKEGKEMQKQPQV
jgi:small subunit ribosomal protein S2